MVTPEAGEEAYHACGDSNRAAPIVVVGALRDLAAWSADGREIEVAVNIAAPELLGSTVLPELGTILAREGVASQRLAWGYDLPPSPRAVPQS